MKELLKTFRESVLREEYLHDYIKDGMVRLYHYAHSSHNTTLILDPSRLFTDTGIYSRNERLSSNVPRVFFYTSLAKVEPIIFKGRELYSTIVPADQIYDIKLDPDKYMDKFRNLHLGRVLPAHDGMDQMLEEIKKKYKGVYYSTQQGSYDLVAWFDPIKVEKV